jgi:hypothetical protein
MDRATDNNGCNHKENGSQSPAAFLVNCATLHEKLNDFKLEQKSWRSRAFLLF